MDSLPPRADGRPVPAASVDERSRLRRLPSEYFDDNIASTFITDHYGVANRREVGVTQMMWSSDYPHGGSDWPDSRASIESQMVGVPDDERHLLLAANAMNLYGVG